MLFLDRDTFARSRVATHAGVTLLHGKCAETPEFDPIAARHGFNDFVKDRRYDPLNIALVQVRVFIGNLLYQFGSYHLSPREFM